MSDDNGWNEYQRLVLDKLSSQGKDIRYLRGELADIRVELGMLKVRAGIWGAVGGVLAVLGPIAIGVIVALVKT